MTFYEQLRHFADSYFLIFMFVIFLSFCLWPFRPGGKRSTSKAAHSIFEDETDGE